MQLWLYDRDRGTKRQISFIDGGIVPDSLARFSGYIGDPLRYSWSPDGRQIAFSSQVVLSGDENVRGFPDSTSRASGQPIELTTSTPADWTLFGVVSYGNPADRTYNDGTIGGRDVPRLLPRRTAQLFLLDVESGRALQITTGATGFHTPEWAPDGRRLAFMSAEAHSLLGGGPTESDIFTLDLATRRITKVTSGVIQKTLPRWSHDGRRLGYYGQDVTGTSFRKGEGIYVVDDVGTGAPSDVTSGVDRHIDGFEWSPDGRSIYFTVWDGLYRPLRRADTTGGKLTAVTPKEAFVDTVCASPGGVTWSQLLGPNSARTMLYANRRERIRAVAELEPGRDPRRQRRYEAVEWGNSHGDRLEGIVIYPVNFQKGRAYPVVVDAYGVNSIDRGADKFNFVLASPNYLVFQPNHRAPHMWVNPLKDPRYTAAAVGPGGISVMVDDILSGLDMLADRGVVDQSRMCLFGFSNGGLEAEQVLTQTGRFKCAVLESPSPSDWLTSFFMNTDDPQVIRLMYGRAPWEAPELYTTLSPLFHVDKITTPILLAAGDQESAVLTSIEMYNALRYLRKNVTFLRYSMQGHGFTDGAEEDFTKRMAAFFSAHLED